MKKTKFLALLLALVMVVGIVAACDSGGTPDQPATTPPPADTSGGGNETTDGGEEVIDIPQDHEYYEFEYYMNYDWYGVQEWGSDLTSKHWGELFNIHANINKPDAAPEDLMTIMITSGDFPDAIWMERDDWNRRLARDGYLVDLDTLKPLVGNNWYDDNILAQTQGHLKIDGVLYGIPNWARKDASGGNNGWMYTQSIYEAAGAPEITVFSDLYDYAVNVRDNVKDSYGSPVIPVSSEGGYYPGENILRGFYKSFGGAHDDGWWTAVDSKYVPIVMDPLYQDALIEANKWYREGLFSATMLTDTRDQFLEYLADARIGLIWFDQSHDDGLNFRKNVRANFPGDSIELITFEGDGMTRIYPPANGLAPGRIYGEHYGTIGWNVTCIFNTAEKPERIFELVTYLLTKQGSIEMMYGPQGGAVWSELDANGNPILNFNPDDHPEEVADYALWHWTLAGHADNVDHTKFAVNAAMPEDQRSWVITNQSDIFTPLMRPLTDEYINVRAVIAPDTPLAIARTHCDEYWREMLPQIIMASSEDAAKGLIQDVLDFFEANSIQEIMAEQQTVYDANLAIQGGSIFTR
ncbi:MAG: extracellular solute-binding protein [Oscillospiraceae bacterium]|nr:extracellular solute-binding protein [Oscillospiraceae bacterium]